MTTKNLSAVQASLGYSKQRTTQVYAKTIALLSSETGEKTASVIFKDNRVVEKPENLIISRSSKEMAEKQCPIKIIINSYIYKGDITIEELVARSWF